MSAVYLLPQVALIKDSAYGFRLTMIKGEITNAIYRHEKCGRLLTEQACDCTNEHTELEYQDLHRQLGVMTEGRDAAMNETAMMSRGLQASAAREADLIDRLGTFQKEQNNALVREVELKNQLRGYRQRVDDLEDRFLHKLVRWWRSRPW